MAKFGDILCLLDKLSLEYLNNLNGILCTDSQMTCILITVAILPRKEFLYRNHLVKHGMLCQIRNTESSLSEDT